MDFRILGPLEVSDDDRQVALGGARQRALLGMLLLHANEVVSSDRLIDELWPGEGLDQGSKALQVAVSRLRKALDPGLIVTRPPGYQLQLEAERLDLRRFEALVAEGRASLSAGDPGAGAARLREALDLWRGEPLADLAYESFCQSDLVRLEELRAAAHEDRIAADLELGRHAELVPELQDLVAQQPMRERPRASLILALYRSGRQAEALAAYQEAREALVEELGIEPGRELQELQQAILQQDPGLDSPLPDEAAPPAPSRGVFVGRGRELEALLETLDDTLAGRGRLVLLAGEPGIGKSRLADELMGHARARNARVLVGRCWEAGGAPAYWPWVQALRAYVRDAEPPALRVQLGAGAGDLAQLIPEVGELFSDLPVPPPPESEGARFRLFEAVTALLRGAARDCPLVLVLDDLHAADEPSLLLLRFVARELADSRLLVVCAFRDVDPALREPMTAALAELVREPQTVQVSLAGLNEGDVGEYIELSTGMESAAGLVQAIRAETEGNPLFVAEVVNLLHSEGQIGQADAHLSIPPGVRAVIGQRVGRLSEPCRNLLAAACVMGREFGVDALARLTDLPRNELLQGLDEAVAERVVGDVPGSRGRLRFGHALIRDTLYDELSSMRRLQLHRDAGEALEAVYHADLDPHLAEVAQHYIAAASAGVEGKAAEFARRAGDRAASQLAHEEAARLYEMALTLVGEDEARCKLLLALGDAQARVGAAPASRRSFRDAAKLAEALGLHEHLAQAALGYGGRLIWEALRDDPDYAPLLERALAALGEEDSQLRVRVLARLASGPLRNMGVPPERRRVRSAQALEMARRIGDPGTLAYALAAYNAANHSPAFTLEQVALSTELIEVATKAGDLERAAEGHEYRAVARIELGELGRARADVAAFADLAAELRQPSQEAVATAYRALLALLEGDLAEAEGLTTDLLRLAERAQVQGARESYDLQVYALRRDQGRLAEVEDFVRRSAERDPAYPLWHCVLAHMAAELGHAAEARHGLDALAADGFAYLPFDHTWLAGISLLADTASKLGDREHATDLYELLLPWEDRVAVSYADFSTGSVARYLGLLAAVTERWDDAERHFEAALEMNERIGARPWLAHTQRDYARMLRARDEPGDRERSRELERAADAANAEQGMPITDPSAGTAPSTP